MNVSRPQWLRYSLFVVVLYSVLTCDAFAARAEARGTLVAEYDYDPYGRLIRETGPKAASCTLRYSTKYRDPDLDLYYYGHRWYDAAAMKWLTPDPIGERGGANLTAFCSGDPINQVDPLGLEEFEVVGRVPHTFDATDLLRRYIPSLDQLIGFRIDPGANDGRGALYVFLPAAYLEPGVLREEAAQGDGRYSREASEQEYAWFFLALWEQNVRENERLSADLQAIVGLGYQADPRAFAADLGRIWRAYHRGETSKLILKDAGQRLVFSALFAGIGYSVRKAKDAATTIQGTTHAVGVLQHAPAASADDVAGGAAKSGPGRIVLGENMDRVRAAAQRLGAETFEGTGMEANRAWVQMKRAQAYEVYDIGPDFARRAQRVEQGIRPDSPFYNMERMEMKGYENYFKLFERSGKYKGGTPGIDY